MKDKVIGPRKIPNYELEEESTSLQSPRSDTSGKSKGLPVEWTFIRCPVTQVLGVELETILVVLHREVGVSGVESSVESKVDFYSVPHSPSYLGRVI